MVFSICLSNFETASSPVIRGCVHCFDSFRVGLLAAINSAIKGRYLAADGIKVFVWWSGNPGKEQKMLPQLNFKKSIPRPYGIPFWQQATIFLKCDMNYSTLGYRAFPIDVWPPATAKFSNHSMGCMSYERLCVFIQFRVGKIFAFYKYFRRFFEVFA